MLPCRPCRQPPTRRHEMKFRTVLLDIFPPPQYKGKFLSFFPCKRSADGYSLFACSLDETVATSHFEVKEVGRRISDAELDELKRNRYGDARGRQANLAESPAQLLLEAASAKQPANKKVTSNAQQNQTSVRSFGDLGVLDVSQTILKSSDSQPDDRSKNRGASGGDELNRVPSPVRISSPMKQRVYRHPDGRKRIIPEVVGVPVHQENICGGTTAQALEPNPADQRNAIMRGGGFLLMLAPGEGSLKRPFSTNFEANHSGVKERFGITARATISENLVIERVPVSAKADGTITVEISGVVKACVSQVGCSTALSIRVFDKKEGEDSIPVCLDAHFVEQAVTDIAGVENMFTTKVKEVTCTRGA